MGKARQGTDINDEIRQIKNDNSYLNGQSRNNSNRSTNQISARASVDNNIGKEDKFSVKGGMIRGSFSWFKTTTATLGSSGIIDMLTYNSPRIIITNTGGNTLKVLNPVMGDGQFLLLRGVTGQTTPIQNTSGTGSVITGNIETMAGTTYNLTGDDWLAFIYDSIDSKWHQFTGGKLNIGSGTGEVFTWTANHSANGFSLTNVDDISFQAGGTAQAGMNSNSDGLEWTVSGTTRWYEWWQNSVLVMKVNQPDFDLYSDDDDGVKLKLHNTSSSGANDYASRIFFYALDSGTTERAFGSLGFLGDVVTAGALQSTYEIRQYYNNVLQPVLTINSDDEIVRSIFGFKASGTTEISYQVDNSTITIGSRGTIQIPTDTNTGATITDDTALDSLFGDEQGCVGVTGLRGSGTPIFWVRRADGASPLWKGIPLTSSST